MKNAVMDILTDPSRTGYELEQIEIVFRILDIHPFFNLRVNVNAQMLKPTYETFDIREGDGMYLASDERIVIWGPDAG